MKNKYINTEIHKKDKRSREFDLSIFVETISLIHEF